jgi:hypothetical protein
LNTEEKKKAAFKLIEKCSKLFSNEEKKQAKFEEVITEDGTILRCEGELREGVEIFVVVEEEEVLASEGTFILENGTELTVDEEGKVVSMVENETTEEEEEEETFSKSQVDEMLKNQESELASKFEEEKTKILKEAKDSLKQDFDSKIEEVRKEVNSMFAQETKEQPKKKKVEMGILTPRQRAVLQTLPSKK